MKFYDGEVINGFLLGVKVDNVGWGSVNICFFVKYLVMVFNWFVLKILWRFVIICVFEYVRIC